MVCRPVHGGRCGGLARHPDVELAFVGASPEDVIVRIIGGAPPDLVGLPPPALAQWAEQGLIEPLSPLIARDGINPGDFIPPVWESVTYKGEVWGMPLIVDPNFGLVYNKRLFAEAGLDPENPPRTIEELETAFNRLIRHGQDGLVQFPIIMWDVYGPTNTLLTWSWAFGGEFADPNTGELIFDHPKTIEALEWLDRYYQQYAGDVAALMVQTGVDTPLELFINERLAMIPTHSGGVAEILNANPNIEIGITVLPHDPATGMDPTWIGGWALAIPKGASNPELAWELVKELTATPEGTTAFATHAGWFTGYIPSDSWDEFMSDPVLGPFVDIVLNAGRARPATPVYHSFEQEGDIAVVDLFERRVFTARDVLARIARRVDDELARMFEGQ